MFGRDKEVKVQLEVGIQASIASYNHDRCLWEATEEL